MVERQELWCHECGNYVQFDLDLSLNGNHILNCPVCGHEHCRVVEDGKITDIRWDQRNPGLIFTVSSSSVTWSSSSSFYSYTSSNSTYTSTGSGRAFLYQSWMNTGS